MITIRTFRPAEWPQYRSVRLMALQEAPYAFGSTYEEAVNYPDEMWKQRLALLDQKADLALGAFDGKQAVGLAWGKIEPDCRERADLYQMWGSPDIRGLGVGRRLLQGVISWAREQGARYMVLGVTVGNTPAEQLYISAGFVPFGEPEPLRENASTMVQNMRLGL